VQRGSYCLSQNNLLQLVLFGLIIAVMYNTRSNDLNHTGIPASKIPAARIFARRVCAAVRGRVFIESRDYDI